MPEYSDLSVLIVDPSQGMRASLHNMLTQVAINRIDHAVSAGTAIRLLSNKSYDLILCEYDLDSSGASDNGQDGQQLLEDLRHHKLIGPWCIFIMLTSEGVYGKVVSAAELTPTDYILKPFTVDVLSQRIARAVERRTHFLPVYQMLAQGRPEDAIARCSEAEAALPRYATEFTRLRAELALSQGRLAEAEALYSAILAARPLGWAQLGRAKCQFQQQRHEDARHALETLLAENPKFMAAYDLLAQTHQALGQAALAQQVLQDAIAISPHMVRRLRHLGEVALAAGDLATAEKACRQVVAKAKYSEFRAPEDHARLVAVLVQKGDAAGAAGVIRDLDRSLRGAPGADVCRAYASALVQDLNGRPEAAAAELAGALAALPESKGVPVDIKLGLARCCIAQQMDQQATALLDALIDDAGSGVTAADAVALCRTAGRADLAEQIGPQVDQQVEALVMQAAARSRQSDLAGAVAVLRQALRRNGSHQGLLSATVTAMLRQLRDQGWDAALGQHCAALLARLRALDGRHPLLAALTAQHAALAQPQNAQDAA